MGDTRRHVQYGWDMSNPKFRELFPEIKSDKHQQRDRRSRNAAKNHRKRFMKGICGKERYTIQREIEKKDLRDELEQR